MLNTKKSAHIIFYQNHVTRVANPAGIQQTKMDSQIAL